MTEFKMLVSLIAAFMLLSFVSAAGDGAYLPGTQAFSQVAHVYTTLVTTPSITTAMITQTVVPIKCNHDNCLRSFIRAGPPAASFCSEYTTDSSLASSSYGLPDYAMSCWGNNYFSISSACTCLNGVATRTSTPAKTTDSITTPKTSTPTFVGYTKQTQSSAKSVSIPSSSTYMGYTKQTQSSGNSVSIPSTLTATSVGYITPAQTPGKSVSIPSSSTYMGYTKQTQSSGKSVSMPSSSTVNIYGPASSSSSTLSSMTSTSALTPSAPHTRTTTITSWTTIYSTRTNTSTPTSFYDVSSTTSPLTKTEKPSPSYTDHATATSDTSKTLPYPASETSSAISPSATKGSYGGWITLPASDAMVKCSKSKECQDAGGIFNSCTKFLSPQSALTTQECLCAPLTFADWNRTTSTCSDCIAAALPAINPATQYPPTNLTYIVQFATNRYCTVGLVRLDQLVKAGQVITSAFQSPILYFNMTVLDSPIPAFGSTSEAKPKIVMEPNLLADLEAALSV